MFFEGLIWNGNYGYQAWLEETFGAPFYDFAGSVVVHGMGGIAAGIFGLEALGGMGGVTFIAQLVGSLTGVAVALIGGFAVYGLVNKVSGLRLSQEEYNGADLSIHKIASTSED